jgi:hypothetical protein
MKNFTTGIMTLFTAAPGGVHNDFYNDIGGKLFKIRVPMDTSLPYAVFDISAIQSDTFKDTITEVSVRFSLFSGSSSTSEIEDMHTHLKTLFDDVQFTVTGNTIVFMIWQSSDLLDIPADTEEGTDEVYQYVVDYRCMVQKT